MDTFDSAIPFEAFKAKIMERNLGNEFKHLRSVTETPQMINNCVGQEHKELNRYSDMLPCILNYQLISQVKHTIAYCDEDQYINANYVDHKTILNHQKAFIAAMGPVKKSILHFWKMVWNNKVQLVVMLCQLANQKGAQCEQYWPTNELVMGDFQLSLDSEQEISTGLIQRVIKVKCQEEERCVVQLQWLGWPDFGVPTNQQIEQVDQIVQKMQQQIQSSTPIVVHCSAGVGRTGTLLACCQIKLVVEQPDQRALSIFNIVRQQREQRICLVLTEDQYKFCYLYAQHLLQ